ncbi:MAG: ImmA/IrrE family metallo-endopeptidase [Pseudomonadota bacterium]
MSYASSYQLRGYVVNPLSVRVIRDKASYVRSALGLTKEPIDLEIFLERLSEFGITVDVVNDEDMPGFSYHSEACCIPETATIYLTEGTYRKACLNDARTRFTIFHELGHLILGHSRELHRANMTTNVKPFQDSEWQADRFAGEITMPLEIIYDYELFSVGQIKNQFGVSEQAATTRYNQLLKEGVIKN